jgi:hypothetical protein
VKPATNRLTHDRAEEEKEDEELGSPQELHVEELQRFVEEAEDKATSCLAFVRARLTVQKQE